MGTASVVETLCGQTYGALKYEMLGIYLQRSTILLVSTGIFITLIYIFTKPILKLIGQSNEITSAAALFVHGPIPQIFAYTVNFPIQKFLQAQSIVLPSALISGATFVLHILLTWVFVYKAGLGLLGAGLVLSLSWWIIVVGQFVYIVTSSRCKNTWSGFSLQAFSGLMQLFKLSAEATCSTNINVVDIYIYIYMLSSVRVSNELGAGHGESVAFSVAVVDLVSFILCLIAAIVVLALGNGISYAFMDGEIVARAVSELCPLLAFSLILNGIQPLVWEYGQG